MDLERIQISRNYLRKLEQILAKEAELKKLREDVKELLKENKWLGGVKGAVKKEEEVAEEETEEKKEREVRSLKRKAAKALSSRERLEKKLKAAEASRQSSSSSSSSDALGDLLAGRG